MPKFTKKKYKFAPFPALVDVFVDGFKVIEKHNAARGHIYLFTESDEVEIKPHDPRIPVQVELTENGPVEVNGDFVEVPPSRAIKDFV